MSSKVKRFAGAVLPVVAAAIPAAFPALAPFAPLIVGAAGLAGSYLAQTSIPLSDWDNKKFDRDYLLSNLRTTQKTIPLIYGRRLVGSNDVYMDLTKDGSDRYFWVVSCLCEGEIEGIAQSDDSTPKDLVYINDILVSEFNEKHRKSPSDPDIVEYYLHKGTPTQTVDTYLNAASPDFTDSMRNIAYMVWKIRWDKKLFVGIPARKAVILGRKIYNLDGGGTSWSVNPVDQLYDYLTNDRYGMAIQASQIDTNSFSATAIYCKTEDKWETHFAIVRQMKSQSIIDNFLAHFRGELTWFDGQIRLRYSELEDEALSGEINNRDIATDEEGKDLVVVRQPNAFSTPDAALIKYTSEQKNWTTDDVYLGDSSGQITPMSFDGFTDRSRALEMGMYMLERTRLNRSYTVTTRPGSIMYEPGDLLTVESEDLGLSSKTLRLIESIYQSDGLVSLSFMAESWDLYNNVYDSDPAVNYKINIASPTDPPPSVLNIGFSEEVYSNRSRTFIRLNVSFDAPQETDEGETYPWFDHARVYVSYDQVSWEFLFNAPDDFQIDPVSEGPIWVKLVSVSIYGQAQGLDEAAYGYYRVRGVSERKPEWATYFYATVVSNLLVIEIPETDFPDIDGYEIRIGNDWPNSSYDRWVDATFLAFSYKQSVFINNIKPGIHSIWVDARGKNGLYSGLPVKRIIKVYEPPSGYLNYDAYDDLPDIDFPYSGGTHSGTEPYVFNGYLSLIVDRGSGGDNLTGTYESQVFNVTSPSTKKNKPVLLSVSCGLALKSPLGNTWDDIAPPPGLTKWTTLAPNNTTTTWKDIMGEDAAPANVRISILQAESTLLFELAGTGLEGICCEITKPYIKVRITIEDSTLSGYYVVGPAVVKRFARPQNILDFKTKATAMANTSKKLTLTVTPPPSP